MSEVVRPEGGTNWKKGPKRKKPRATRNIIVPAAVQKFGSRTLGAPAQHKLRAAAITVKAGGGMLSGRDGWEPSKQFEAAPLSDGLTGLIRSDTYACFPASASATIVIGTKLQRRRRIRARRRAECAGDAANMRNGPFPVQSWHGGGLERGRTSQGTHRSFWTRDQGALRVVLHPITASRPQKTPGGMFSKISRPLSLGKGARLRDMKRTRAVIALIGYLRRWDTSPTCAAACERWTTRSSNGRSCRAQRSHGRTERRGGLSHFVKELLARTNQTTWSAPPCGIISAINHLHAACRRSC